MKGEIERGQERKETEREEKGKKAKRSREKDISTLINLAMQDHLSLLDP